MPTHNRILKKIATIPWAISEEWLEQIYAIAEREVDIVALEAKLGKKLEYSHKTTFREGVAVIPIEGPIFPKANVMTEFSEATSLAVVAQDFQAALDNSDVESIVLQINSPGGAVTGVDEMYSLIRAADKPVTAHVSGMGASAAYWIASATDRVLLTPTSKVGSIGVVQIWDIDEDKDSKLEFVSSVSPRKRLDPKSDEGKEAIFKGINSIAEVFVSNVAEGRKVSRKDVEQNFGRGGMLVGQAAVDVGMADGILTFEELMTELSEQNYSSHGEYSMNVKELKAKHPDVYDAVIAEGKTAAEGEASSEVDSLRKSKEALEAENAKLKADLTAQTTASEETLSRLKELERKDAIREEKAAEAQAGQIMAAALSDSTIPPSLHPKVAAAVNHADFMEDGTFDAASYTEAVKAEVADWASAFSSAPLAGGAGDSGSEGRAAGNSEKVDTAVASLFAHIN